jgi:hypothetical protein
LADGLFTNSGGTIRASGTGSRVQFANGTGIQGGTVSTTLDGVIETTNGITSLQDLTLNGTIRTLNNSNLQLLGSINNQGTIAVLAGSGDTDLLVESEVTLSGAGQIALSSSGGGIARLRDEFGAPDGHLINQDNLIRGFGNLGADRTGITNRGVIDADTAATTLTVDPRGADAVENGPDAVVNSGTLRATNGGRLALAGGRFNNAEGMTQGTIEAQDGSTVALGGADIVGGLLKTSGSGLIETATGSGGFFTDLTTDGLVRVNNGHDIQLTGTITNQGTIEIKSDSNDSDLRIESEVMLTGGGQVVLSTTGGGISRIRDEFGTPDGHLINVNNLIRGFGQVGQDRMQVTNQSGGTIRADVAGQTLSLDPAGVGSITNQGNLEATNGGILTLASGDYVNAGGTIRANGVNSAVRLANNAHIFGGTLTTDADGIIETTAGSNTLENVSNLGRVRVNNGHDIQLNGTLTNQGTIEVNAGSSDTDLRIEGEVMLTGGGQVVLSMTGSGIARLRDEFGVPDGHLINVNNVIRGRGDVGQDRTQITNQSGGTIRADVTGQTLTVDPNGVGVTNQGILEATDGGFLSLAAGDHNNAGGTIRALGVGSAVRLANNAHVFNGTLETDADGVIETSGFSIVENVTIDGTVRVNNSNSLELRGTINNLGNTIELAGAGNFTNLFVEGDVALTGGGEVHMIGLFSRIHDEFGVPVGHLTSDNYIHGRGQIGGDGARMLFTNSGIVEADAGAVNGPLSIRGRGGDAGGHPGVVNTETGIFRASNNSTLNLSASGGGEFTNNGTIESIGDGSVVQTANSAVLTNLAGGVLTGGTYRVVSPNGATNFTTLLLNAPNSAISTIAAGTTVEMSGSELLTNFQSGAQPLIVSLATNSGTLKLLNAQAFNMSNALVNNGAVELGGLGLAGGTLNSGGNITNAAGAQIFGHGTISDTVLNSGTVRAANGTLAIVGGIIDGQSGTIQIDAGASLDLSGASGDSDADILNHNGTNLNLGANDILVRDYYANANFGFGNSFNPRANVTGTGQILAEPGYTQQLTGDVTDGATASPTMNLGVVRIGQPGVTKSYNIVFGSPGPNVTGAVMSNNATFGASITNSQLTGNGVVASDFSAVAGSNLNNYEVTLTGQAGGQGALSAQTVAIVNNFDNIQEQVLTLNGEVWQPAVPNISPPGPINLGNFHVTDAASTLLSIANNAPISAFSENLIAAVTGSTGDANFSGGPSVNVAPGAANNTIGVGINTNTGGAKIGTVTFSRKSTGATGLSDLDLGDQVITVSAGVYRFASPVVGNLNLGDRHVGQAAAGNLNVQNTAVADSFSESLGVAIFGSSGDVSSATGGPATIAPGANSGTALNVALNTATAGPKAGMVTYELTSIANASGLSDTPLGQQSANVSATVYNLAVGQLTTMTPIDFGIVHVGDNPAAVALSIKNNAPAGQYSENLNVSTGPHGIGVTGGGSINGLAPQATDGSSLTVDIATASVGLINANFVVNYTSDGTGINSLGQTILSSANVPVTAQVNNFAVADVVKLSGNGTFMQTAPNEFKLDLGSVFQHGTDLSADLGILNDVSALLPADTLAGSFSVNVPGFLVAGVGPFAGIAAGATYANPTVTLDSATIGMFSGQIVLHPRSQNASGYDQPLASGNITINIMGEVTIPEPAAFTLLALGMACLAVRRRR